MGGRGGPTRNHCSPRSSEKLRKPNKQEMGQERQVAPVDESNSNSRSQPNWPKAARVWMHQFPVWQAPMDPQALASRPGQRGRGWTIDCSRQPAVQSQAFKGPTSDPQALQLPEKKEKRRGVCLVRHGHSRDLPRADSSFTRPSRLFTATETRICLRDLAHRGEAPLPFGDGSRKPHRSNIVNQLSKQLMFQSHNWAQGNLTAT